MGKAGVLALKGWLKLTSTVSFAYQLVRFRSEVFERMCTRVEHGLPVMHWYCSSSGLINAAKRALCMQVCVYGSFAGCRFAEGGC